MTLQEWRELRELMENAANQQRRLHRASWPDSQRCVVCGYAPVNTFTDEPPLCSYHDDPPKKD